MARGYTRLTLPIALTVTCLVASLGPGQRLQARIPAGAGPSAALQRPAALAANPAGRAATHSAVLRASTVGRHGVAVQRVGRDGGTPNVSREVPELRTRTSDTYVGADGVYTVHQSFQSINYQDTRGAWQPISNTLVAAAPNLAAQGFAYQNAANDYTVAFAASSGGAALERITRHGVTLDLSPTGAQAAGDSALTATLPLSLAAAMTAGTPTAMSATSNTPAAPSTEATPTATDAIMDVVTPLSATVSMSPQIGAPIVAGAAITYTNLYTATDAVYNVRDDAVKESLILRDASAPSSFTFAARVDGARPHMTGVAGTPGARTTFLDAAGREQLALEPLVAVDARGATTPVSLTLSPVIGAGIGGAATFQLRATIPPAWLADPSRVWPVALDPSVGLPLTQLVTINSTNGGLILYSRLCPPNTSPTCPDQQRLLYNADLIGNQGPTGISSTIGRDLLQFDLSPLPPALPHGKSNPGRAVASRIM